MLSCLIFVVMCLNYKFYTSYLCYNFPVDCLLPNCSGNGVCALGQCVCYKGFKGTDCSIPDKINITHLCTKNCSGHGTYNVEEGTCECERFFMGRDCETGKWNSLCLEYLCYCPCLSYYWNNMSTLLVLIINHC